MKMVKYIVAACAFITFVSVCIFGAVVVSTHHHQPGCPFMPGEDVVCQMTVYEHLSAWKFVQIAIPLFLSLFAIVALRFVAVRFVRLVILPCTVWSHYKTSSIIHFSDLRNFYSELFSEGILHPRVP